MPLTKNAAFRYRIIDACLRNPRKRNPSIEDIQRVVSEAMDLDNTISLSSLHNDLKFMRQHYKAPIVYDKSKGGYRYEDEHFSINSFPLTQDEITVLDLSISFLRQIKHSGFYSEFESAIEKIISGFRISKIEGYAGKRLLETEEPTADTGIRWLEHIYEPIIMKMALQIDYRKFSSPECNRHVLSPYLLRESRNRWYVTGHTALTGQLVTLALDRILDLTPSEMPFVETPSFDVEKFLRHALGITSYPNAEPHRVRLLFDKSQLGYIRSKPMHHSQRIVENPRGFIVELECYLTPELEMHILSLGEYVKVLGPVGLAERVERRIRAMASTYIGNTSRSSLWKSGSVVSDDVCK